MIEDEALRMIGRAGAVRENDHFVLTSGLHTATYVVKDLVSAVPGTLELLAADIAYHFRGNTVQVVVAPAVGAIPLGNRVSFNLGPSVLSVYAEEMERDKFVIRRGFEVLIKPGTLVGVVEDIITTGRTTRGVMAAVQELGGVVRWVGLLWNRSTEEFGVPVFACVNKIFPNFLPEECVLCKEGKPINAEVNKHGREFLGEYGEDPSGWPANRAS